MDIQSRYLTGKRKRLDFKKRVNKPISVCDLNTSDPHTIPWLSKSICNIQYNYISNCKSKYNIFYISLLHCKLLFGLDMIMIDTNTKVKKLYSHSSVLTYQSNNIVTYITQ